MTSGLPKWEPELWRGATNPRLRLKENETLGALTLLLTDVVTPVAYRKAALASGASQNAIDAFTGNEFATVPKGYTYFVLGYGYTFDQIARIRGYTDGLMNSSAFFGSFKPDWLEGARPWYDVVYPYGLAAHAHVNTITNLSGDSMVGFYNAPYVLVEVGTKRPTHKDVICASCGKKRRVNRRATRVKCKDNKCKFITFYRPMLFGEKEKPIHDVVES